VEDHCRALDVIIHQGQPGETYCVGGETEMTNKAIAQMILDFMGYDEEMIEYVKDRPGHDRRYAMDFSRMRQEFGWQPTIAFEPGLSAMIDWYRENQEWWQRIKSGAYQNYYHRQYGQL
jgi:dTDP-glucose 4,6-dehydratase